MKFPFHLQSAFPIHPDYCDGDQPIDISKGMTLRDYIAIAALSGDWSPGPDSEGFHNEASDDVLEARARLYYRMADAMLKVRVE